MLNAQAHQHVDEMMLLQVPRPMIAAHKWIVPNLKTEPIEWYFFPNLHEVMKFRICKKPSISSNPKPSFYKQNPEANSLAWWHEQEVVFFTVTQLADYKT